MPDATDPGTRRIRVYDPKGDFVIEVPADVQCTFGYFNPASPKFADGGQQGRGGFDMGHPNVARQTALRIYAGKATQKNQIAVFLGVTGYRFEDLKVTKLEEAITIVRSYSDDPETGLTEESTKRQQVLKAIPEKGSYS